MALINVMVPDIGDFDEVAVIELLVKVGDTVKAEQSLITVESDKASMEIPSSTAGVVKELKVALGDKVKQGSVVLVVEAAGEAAASAPVAAAPAAAAAPVAAPAPAAAAPTASGPVQVLVPDIGDFKDVAVIEVLVKPGDKIALEQSLITVESDKASMEIPSSHAGVLKELKVKVGDTVNIGDLLAILEGAVAASPSPQPSPQGGEGAKPAAAAPQAASVSVVAAPAPHNPTAAAPVGLPHASPSVRKFARELGVPLAEVKGSGLKGRITAEDIQSFTKSVMAGAVQTAAQAAKAPASTGGGGSELGLIPWPKVDFAKFGPIERKEMGRIKKISGANLLRNAVMIPVPRLHQQGEREERRQGDDARLLDQSLRGRAQEIPRVQQLA